MTTHDLLLRVVLVLAAALGLPAFARGQSDPPDASSTLASHVQPFVDREELAGAVMLVADRHKTLAVAAVGRADIAAKKPKHPITVRNVLTHTSGLPFKSALEGPTLDQYPLSARVRSYAMTPLEFEPDSKYQYSNAGINTAARIIEVVAGVPYERFLEARLFRPLGMRDTTFWPSEAQAARIAKSYKPGLNNKGLEETTIGQLRYPLTDRVERFPMPAGGLFSTAHDVARYYQMLLNGGQLDGRRLLSEAAVKRMTSRQTPPGLRESYGFGIAAAPSFFGHGGAYSTNRG